MKERFYYAYSLAYVWLSDYRKQAKEAICILKYAISNGFPHGDEEYESIIRKAGI